MTSICSICTESADKNTFTTQCNHSFHISCLFNWFNESENFTDSSCPNCRAKIEIGNVYDELKYSDIDCIYQGVITQNKKMLKDGLACRTYVFLQDMKEYDDYIKPIHECIYNTFLLTWFNNEKIPKPKSRSECETVFFSNICLAMSIFHNIINQNKRD